ncbi:glycosyltransferase [Vagococcus carniphilus]|uniref:glycosyltransferase n=1 Tax=Vagococcus carniphilus TaxID=218144 RepID=UPI003B5CCEA6
MIYCIGNGLGKKLPGIEHSQVKRIKLFHQLGEKAKIIVLNHSVDLYDNAEIVGVSSSVFSIYDYFQEAIGDNQYSMKDYYEYWLNDSNYRVQLVNKNNDVKIFYEDDYIAYAHFYDEDFKKIHFINYFDTPYEDRRIIKREVFDKRGFLSVIQVLGEKNKLVSERFFSPSGEEKIVCYYNIDRKISRIELLNYKNKIHYFKNKDEWQAFFLDELNQEDVLFFSDRTISVMKSVTLMKTKIKLIPVIHSVHLRQPFVAETSDITSPYQCIFNHLEYVTGVVVSTKWQQEELNRRLPENTTAYSIPVGSAEIAKKVPFEKRNPYKIVCMARYFSEKQLLHQIKVIQQLLHEFPKLELHLFGYGDSSNQFKEEKFLKQYVKEHHLEEHVFFKGYLIDLDTEYNEAGAMLLTSTVEGFCLSLLEAIEHGVPVISYDIRYGPREMIQQGKNGYLVEKNNVDEMRDRLSELLSQTELHKEMSNNAYEVAKEFSKEKVLGKWQNLLEVENK